MPTVYNSSAMLWEYVRNEDRVAVAAAHARKGDAKAGSTVSGALAE